MLCPLSALHDVVFVAGSRVGFWPFTQKYSYYDSSGWNSPAFFSPTVGYATGPTGLDNGALRLSGELLTTTHHLIINTNTFFVVLNIDAILLWVDVIYITSNNNYYYI